MFICLFLYFTRVDSIDVSDTSLASKNESLGFTYHFEGKTHHMVYLKGIIFYIALFFNLRGTRLDNIQQP